MDAATLAWVVLLLATAAAWSLGRGGAPAPQNGEIATAGVIVLAFFKVWVVGFQFMELRHAPGWLRHIFNAWVVAICAVLLFICVG